MSDQLEFECMPVDAEMLRRRQHQRKRQRDRKKLRDRVAEMQRRHRDSWAVAVGLSTREVMIELYFDGDPRGPDADEAPAIFWKTAMQLADAARKGLIAPARSTLRHRPVFWKVVHR